MFNIFKKGKRKNKKPNLTKELRKNLKQRLFELSKELSRKDLEEEERQNIIKEMKSIMDIMPEKIVRSIDISGILAAFGSFVAMILSGLISYKLSNKGLFDKRGESLLNPLNFKK